MTSVCAILRSKAREVVTIEPSATALAAAQRMNLHRIGCLVVIEPRGGEIVGIVSERDILTRLVAEERDPRITTVHDIMTRGVICCTPETPVQELRAVMQSRRVRHVPVTDDNGLCGLVSIGDLNAFEAAGLTATIATLESYITSG
ncbi:Hypoxic response protein 1 [Phycisphaerales bacterium]|nr:Hypoxic response protein 1 [Phycisphaerales bacterium]